jgi:3-hydroxybutyryl-CoA dehydrogenase
MSFDPHRADLTLGIVGAGVMGRGIAQVAAECGVTVLLADARREAVEEARAFCVEMIGRRAAKGTISLEAADAAAARVQATGAGPDTGYADFASCHLAIEAVAERMDVKHAVLAGLEGAVSDDCVIATNTSSLSVTGFAAEARRPERVAGFHFFNPVPLMRVVEVIGGLLTDEAVLDSLAGLARRMGHHPVRAADTPGFIVNHAGRGYGTEALRIASEGIASFADIDRVMTEAAGFRMGPFELLDLTGLDVSHPVMESIYRQYYEEPRYRPSYITAQRLTGGLLGRKTGRGFYAYREGKADRPPEALVPQVDLSRVRVWISDREPEGGRALRQMAAGAGAQVETGPRPSAAALSLVTPIGQDATTTALAEELDPARTLAVDPLFGLDTRRTLMPTPATRPDMRDAAHALLGADGRPVTLVQDSPGFVAQRIAAAIVNIGCDMAQQRIASPEDIDRAVELGLGYRRGPLKLGDHIGAGRILQILEAAHAFYGDPRYRPSPWLKRRAGLSLPLSSL